MHTRMARWLTGMVLGLGLTVASLAGETAAPRPAQLKCPITGKGKNEVANPVAVTADGFTLWTADDASAKKVAENPAGAFAALAKNQDAAEPVSQACPVMGNRVNKDLFVYKEGKRIYVCCKGCIPRVEKNWDAMVKKVQQQAKDGDPKDLKSM